ncbi:hypothetical protein [Fervidibacter sp.]
MRCSKCGCQAKIFGNERALPHKTTRHSLFATRCRFTIRHSLFANHYSLFAIRYSPLALLKIFAYRLKPA